MRESLQRLFEVAEYVRQELGVSDFAWPQLRIFLLVAIQDAIEGHDFKGVPMPEACKKLDMPQSNLSRNFRMLSSYAEKKEDGEVVWRGYGLLQATQNPFNRISWNMLLTDKGRHVAQKLHNILAN